MEHGVAAFHFTCTYRLPQVSAEHYTTAVSESFSMIASSVSLSSQIDDRPTPSQDTSVQRLVDVLRT